MIIVLQYLSKSADSEMQQPCHVQVTQITSHLHSDTEHQQIAFIMSTECA